MEINHVCFRISLDFLVTKVVAVGSYNAQSPSLKSLSRRDEINIQSCIQIAVECSGKRSSGNLGGTRTHNLLQNIFLTSQVPSLPQRNKFRFQTTNVNPYSIQCWRAPKNDCILQMYMYFYKCTCSDAF